MAARDKWSVNLKCPKCGRVGEISFSEEDHSYVRKDTVRIEAMTPGFNVRTFGGAHGQTLVECSDCKALA